MKNLLTLLCLLLFARSAVPEETYSPANITSVLAWDDPDAARTDSVGFSLMFQAQDKFAFPFSIPATSNTNRLALEAAGLPQKKGVFQVTIRKLCLGGLESEPSAPFFFSWNGVQQIATPLNASITTTVTVKIP